MTWFSLYSLGCVQALFLAFILYKSRNQRWQGNVYLSGLLLVIAALLGLFALREELGNRIYPWLFWPIVASPALIGPCLLFYVRSLQSKFSIWQTVNLVHLVPYLTLLALFAPEIISTPSLGLIHLDHETTIAKIQVAAYLKSGLMLLYLIRCLYLLRGNLIGTSIKKETLFFLRCVLASFLIVTLIGSILSTLFWLGIYRHPASDYLELGFLTLVSYLLAYYVFSYEVAPENPKDKYANAALTETIRQSLANSLKQQMWAQKWFTEPDYSARFLAAKLSISEQQLSELIALEFNTNFSGLSNRFRFDYFTELVQTQSDATLLELAMDAGFKSKSSFNRAIKELTGQTPSTYRQQLLTKHKNTP